MRKIYPSEISSFRDCPSRSTVPSKPGSRFAVASAVHTAVKNMNGDPLESAKARLIELGSNNPLDFSTVVGYWEKIQSMIDGFGWIPGEEFTVTIDDGYCVACSVDLFCRTEHMVYLTDVRVSGRFMTRDDLCDDPWALIASSIAAQHFELPVTVGVLSPKSGQYISTVISPVDVAVGSEFWLRIADTMAQSLSMCNDDDVEDSGRVTATTFPEKLNSYCTSCPKKKSCATFAASLSSIDAVDLEDLSIDQYASEYKRLKSIEKVLAERISTVRANLEEKITGDNEPIDDKGILKYKLKLTNGLKVSYAPDQNTVIDMETLLTMAQRDEDLLSVVKPNLSISTTRYNNIIKTLSAKGAEDREVALANSLKSLISKEPGSPRLTVS